MLEGRLLVYLIDEGVGGKDMDMIWIDDTQLAGLYLWASFSDGFHTLVHFLTVTTSIRRCFFFLTLANNLLAFRVLLNVLFKPPLILRLIPMMDISKSEPSGGGSYSCHGETPA
jgi:hypothetical protein